MSRKPRPFSKRQQGIYRAIVKSAWDRHCQLMGFDAAGAKEKARQNAWYRSQLVIAAGVDTTKLLNNTTDFETVCVHFEILTESGLYWQMRKYGADSRRIFHSIEVLAEKWDIDVDYLKGMARQMGLPVCIADQSAEQLLKLLQALKIYIARHLNASTEEQFAMHAAADPDEGDPF